MDSNNDYSFDNIPCTSFYTDSYTDLYADSYSDSYVDPYADPYADSNANPYTDPYADSNAEPQNKNNELCSTTARSKTNDRTKDEENIKKICVNITDP
ncbi:19042_t:CDS:2 [Racocetra fulgida]|uniref:19042_t:CDS:1 n=1 Tax=Racocetra fulgida TaxID=60492 RepID=A0A9N8ZZ03_9GLOM|nr:19042_t:CDS:2 [Racocetra fulgida]